MQIRRPDFYDEFECLAGLCPHSCCEKWEVVIDPETAERYEAVPGALGERLREALQPDEEGEACFSLRGGRCPFLDEENLCEIHRTLGQEATSETCRAHPRFVEEYGPCREITLSASCPAALALLLGSDASLTYPTQVTDEPEEEGDVWLSWLLPLRDHMLDLVQDRTVALRQRMFRLIRLAVKAQSLLEKEDEAALQALEWSEDEEQPVQAEDAVFPAALELLQNLEILEPDWITVLEQAKTVAPTENADAALERICTYFLFRYVPKSVNDGALLARVLFCMFSVLVVERLSGVCGLAEALRRFSTEIEHSAENVETLLEELEWDWETRLLAGVL